MHIIPAFLVLCLCLLPIAAFGSEGHSEDSVLIIPQPQQLDWKGADGFLINSRTRIVINARADEKDLFIARQLRRKIWDTTGHLPTILRGKPGAPTANVIAVGSPDKNASVAAILRSWPDAAGKEPKSEGYILAIGGPATVVQGFDQQGAFYGCQTLIQILEQRGKKKLDGMFCYDYPDMPWRGTMLRIRSNFDVEFTKELISEVMARYKLNTLQLHLSYATVWPSHPELYHDLPHRHANPSTMDQVKSVVDYAKDHFFEVIPGGVSWTHSNEWLTAGDLNQDLLETTARVTHQNLCPRNPKAQKLIRELMEDQIEVFHPKYIQIGWDELGSIGACPRCKGTDPAQLLSEALRNDRDYLMKRGIRPLMWPDMLRPGERRNWDFSNTVNTMPKDIIMQDWIYTGHHADFPSLKHWADKGLQALGAPYGVYPPGSENIYSWAQAAKRHDALGIVAFNKYICGPKQDMIYNQHMKLEISCYPFIGEWGWTADKPHFSPAPYDGVEMFMRRISPCSPRGLTGSDEQGKVTLRWTNPQDEAFTGTWVCYRTDRFPKDPLDGTVIVDKPGSPDASEAFVHHTAPHKGKIYYSVFARDDVRHFSAPATLIFH